MVGSTAVRTPQVPSRVRSWAGRLGGSRRWPRTVPATVLPGTELIHLGGGESLPCPDAARLPLDDAARRLGLGTTTLALPPARVHVLRDAVVCPSSRVVRSADGRIVAESRHRGHGRHRHAGPFRVPDPAGGHRGHGRRVPVTVPVPLPHPPGPPAPRRAADPSRDAPRRPADAGARRRAHAARAVAAPPPLRPQHPAPPGGAGHADPGRTRGDPRLRDPPRRRRRAQLVPALGGQGGRGGSRGDTGLRRSPPPVPGPAHQPVHHHQPGRARRRAGRPRRGGHRSRGRARGGAAGHGPGRRADHRRTRQRPVTRPVQPAGPRWWSCCGATRCCPTSTTWPSSKGLPYDFVPAVSASDSHGTTGPLTVDTGWLDSLLTRTD